MSAAPYSECNIGSLKMSYSSSESGGMQVDVYVAPLGIVCVLFSLWAFQPPRCNTRLAVRRLDHSSGIRVSIRGRPVEAYVERLGDQGLEMVKKNQRWFYHLAPRRSRLWKALKALQPVEVVCKKKHSPAINVRVSHPIPRPLFLFPVPYPGLSGATGCSILRRSGVKRSRSSCEYS
jgi:hypothetical protein